MRGPRLYSLLFWILWGVMSLMVRPDDRNSPEFVIATGMGSFVFPILLYMWCKADAAPARWSALICSFLVTPDYATLLRGAVEQE